MTAAPLPFACRRLPGGHLALTYARAVDRDPERPVRLDQVLDELLGVPATPVALPRPPARLARARERTPVVTPILPRRRVEHAAAVAHRRSTARTEARAAVLALHADHPTEHDAVDTLGRNLRAQDTDQ